MMNAEQARAAMDRAEAEWNAQKGKTEAQKAENGPKEAADAIARMMLKEFWQRGKRFA